MKSSRRELSIIDWFIFKNDQITLFICFTFIPKTDMYLKQELSFTVNRPNSWQDIQTRHFFHEWDAIGPFLRNTAAILRISGSKKNRRLLNREGNLSPSWICMQAHEYLEKANPPHRFSVLIRLGLILKQSAGGPDLSFKGTIFWKKRCAGGIPIRCAYNFHGNSTRKFEQHRECTTLTCAVCGLKSFFHATTDEPNGSKTPFLGRPARNPTSTVHCTL